MFMKRISSSMTFVSKRVFPAIWLGMVAIFFVFGISSGAGTESALFIIQPLLMFVFGLVMFKALVWDLVDEVYDCGDSLLIRNRGREYIVPLSEIMNVSSSTFMKPPRITLRLASPGDLGADVTFMPPRKFSFNPFAKSEVAEDLIERVDRARRERVV
jgi:hypothetical protein